MRALLQRGDYHVRVLDNLSTGKRENLGADVAKVELVEGDLRSLGIVQEAAKDVDVIFHLGALPSVPRSIQDPVTTNEVNVGGTLNVLMAAQAQGVRRVVYASTASVYGNAGQLPVHEELLPNPASPYGVAKSAGEEYCRAFTRTHGLETVCLRYFNVFGPAQDAESSYTGAIAIFISSFLDGQRITVDGSGNQTKDFTYVANVVQAKLLAAEAPKVSGEVFNVACGGRSSVNTVLAILGSLIQPPVEITHGPPRVGDVLHSQADISKAGRLLGYKPTISVEEGIEHTVNWYRTARKR